MLSNVTHSNFYFECNTERGFIDQLYIELGQKLRIKFVETALVKPCYEELGVFCP